jgi:hypothetical protein
MEKLLALSRTLAKDEEVLASVSHHRSRKEISSKGLFLGGRNEKNE